MQVEGHKSSPVPGGDWAGFLRKSALALACLLLASALVCWVAANWEYASILQKLAGGQLALVALVAASWLLGDRPGPGGNRNFSASAQLAGLAALMLGALLALIGQIYQTGADAWTLFIGWLALLLPWLLVLRTVFLGLLCASLLNVGLALYMDARGGWAWFASSSAWLEAGVLLTLANGALVWIWERHILLLDDGWRIGPRALASAAAAWLVVAALASLDTGAGPALLVVPGLAACAFLYKVYAARLPDLAMVSLAAAVAMLLAAILLLSWVDSEFALLAIIAVLLGLTVLFMRRLRGLLSQRGADRTDAAQAAEDPWFIVLFRLAAMGVTALLMVAFLVVVLDLDVERLWIPGVLSCAGGLLLRQTVAQRYIDELGLALTAAGLIMSGIGLFALEDFSPFARAWLLLALGVLLYRWSGNAALRFLTAFIALALASWLTWPETSRYDLWDVTGSGRVWTYFPAYLRLWWLAVAAILALAVGSRRRDPDFWLPLAWALICLTQLIAWLAPAPALQAMPDAWLQAPGLLVLWLACAALPVVALGALLWRANRLPAGLRLGAPAALAVASLGWMGAPGVSMALLWLILAYALAQRTLLVFGALALLAYLGRFYYQLDSTLLHKSLVLGLTGTWLLLSWHVLGRGARRHIGSEPSPQVSSVAAMPDPAEPAGTAGSAAMERRPVPPHGLSEGVSPRMRALGLLAGLIAALGLANAEIYRSERILAQGQPVVLALAPVDPRSLMQGDYMALRFDVADQLPQALGLAPAPVAERVEARRGGYLLLEPDRRGVHRLAAVLADPDAREGGKTVPEGAGDAASAILEFRLRHGVAQIGANAWFFPEGQAGRYAPARFGEFRVDRHGRARLLRLLDEQLAPLPH
ncbi:MAG TPA: GDYXXLXY domain-containing protein [Burkholderiaceae bacterium]|nr:GDYXXLXY domain-containing protein [Burkholderiaceae bacterium]